MPPQRSRRKRIFNSGRKTARFRPKAEMTRFLTRRKRLVGGKTREEINENEEITMTLTVAGGSEPFSVNQSHVLEQYLWNVYKVQKFERERDTRTHTRERVSAGQSRRAGQEQKCRRFFVKVMQIIIPVPLSSDSWRRTALSR